MNKLQSMIQYPLTHKEFVRVLPNICNMMGLRYHSSSDGPMSNKVYTLETEDKIKVEWTIDRTVPAQRQHLIRIVVIADEEVSERQSFEEALDLFRKVVGNKLNENPMTARVVDTLHPSVKILRMGETDVSLFSVRNLLLVSDNAAFLQEFGLKYEGPTNPMEIKRDLEHHAVSAKLRVCEMDVVDPLNGVYMLQMLTATLDSFHMVIKEGAE